MQKVKGTKDIFNNEKLWQDAAISTFAKIAKTYNFAPIAVPVIEHQAVFTRSVGSTTDIVTKEMYVFPDKKGRAIALRPEGTAGVIRAVVENKLYVNRDPLKLYYYGPMFRYERPQKGRQRQFTQLGVELLGDKNPLLDAEVILLAATFLKTLGIKYQLQLNSLGDQTSRASYIKALQQYFAKYQTQLEPISVTRLSTNPLRILDDKIERTKDFVQQAPTIDQFYTQAAREYFHNLTTFLTKLKIPFQVNHHLVRGLDYYTDTAFEFVSQTNDSQQNTLIGGGRYQNLVHEMGGPKLSGIGFAAGLERLMAEFDQEDQASHYQQQVDVFVMNLSQTTMPIAMELVYSLRNQGFVVDWNYRPLKIQKAFVKADQAGAKVKVIVGQIDLAQGQVTIKFNEQQQQVAIAKLPATIATLLGATNEND